MARLQLLNKNIGSTPGGNKILAPTVKSRFEPIPTDYKFIAPTAARESTDYIPTSPTAKFANLSQFLGGGQYTQDSTQPNLLEKSKTRYTPELNKTLAGGAINRNKVEIDHTIPLWLGGTDTPDNKIALPLAEHDIKTKQNAVIEALYYAGKIDLPEARVLAINWKDKDITGINPNPNTGQVSLAVAEKKLKEWQKPTEVSMGDVLKTWGKKLGSALTLGKYKGEPSKTDLGEQMYAESLNEGTPGVLGQGAQGLASGASFGWVSAESKAGEPFKDVLARGTGQLAGTLISFSWLGKLAGMAGKAVFGAKTIKNAQGVETAVTKLPAWLTKLDKTTAAFKPGGITKPKNVASKALMNAGLFSLHGQLSKQEENNFTGRFKRFLSDASFGAMLAVPGQTAKGYAGLAAGTYALSAVEGATPGEAMLNTAIVVGLHGFGAVGYDAKIQKLASEAAIKERLKWGIEPPKPGEKITSERISDENMSVIEKVYQASESPQEFKQNMEALVISGRQLYKGGLGREAKFMEDIKDSRSLVKRTNEMTPGEVDAVPNDIAAIYDALEQGVINKKSIDKAAVDAPTVMEETGLFAGTGFAKATDTVKNKNLIEFQENGGKTGDMVIARWVTDPKEIEFYKLKNKSLPPEKQFDPYSVINIYGNAGGKSYLLARVPTEFRLNNETNGIRKSLREAGLTEDMLPPVENHNNTLINWMKGKGLNTVTGKIEFVTPFASRSSEPFVSFRIGNEDWTRAQVIKNILNKTITSKISKAIVEKPAVTVEPTVNEDSRGPIFDIILKKYPEEAPFAALVDGYKERLAPKDPTILKTGMEEDYGFIVPVEKAKAIVDRADKITVRNFLDFIEANRMTNPRMKSINEMIFYKGNFYDALSAAERAKLDKLKILSPEPKVKTGEIKQPEQELPIKPLEKLQQESIPPVNEPPVTPPVAFTPAERMQTAIPTATAPAKYTALAEQTTGGTPLVEPTYINKLAESRKIVQPTVEKQTNIVKAIEKATVKKPETKKMLRMLTVDGKKITEEEIRSKFKEAKASGDKKEINKWSVLFDKIVKEPSVTVRGNVKQLEIPSLDIIQSRITGAEKSNNPQQASDYKKLLESINKSIANKEERAQELKNPELQKQLSELETAREGVIGRDKAEDDINTENRLTTEKSVARNLYSLDLEMFIDSQMKNKNYGTNKEADIRKLASDWLGEPNYNKKEEIIGELNKAGVDMDKFFNKQRKEGYVKVLPTAYSTELRRGIEKGLKKQNPNAKAFNYVLNEGLKKLFGSNYEQNYRLNSLMNPSSGKGKAIWSDMFKDINERGYAESQPKDVVLKEAAARKEGKTRLTKKEWDEIYQRRKLEAEKEAEQKYETPLSKEEKEMLKGMPIRDMSRLDSITDLTKLDNLFKTLRAAEITGEKITSEDATLTAKDLLYKFIKLHNTYFPKAKKIMINQADLKKITELALK